MPYRVTGDCMLCGACAAGCPSGAIEEGEDRCAIDVTICIECGTCAQNCPAGAIVFVEEGDEAPAG